MQSYTETRLAVWQQNIAANESSLAREIALAKADAAKLLDWASGAKARRLAEQRQFVNMCRSFDRALVRMLNS